VGVCRCALPFPHASMLLCICCGAHPDPWAQRCSAPDAVASLDLPCMHGTLFTSCMHAAQSVFVHRIQSMLIEFSPFLPMSDTCMMRQPIEHGRVTFHLLCGAWRFRCITFLQHCSSELCSHILKDDNMSTIQSIIPCRKKGPCDRVLTNSRLHSKLRTCCAAQWHGDPCLP
jgi:hypothetical protein